MLDSFRNSWITSCAHSYSRTNSVWTQLFTSTAYTPSLAFQHLFQANTFTTVLTMFVMDTNWSTVTSEAWAFLYFMFTDGWSWTLRTILSPFFVFTGSPSATRYTFTSHPAMLANAFAFTELAFVFLSLMNAIKPASVALFFNNLMFAQN